MQNNIPTNQFFIILMIHLLHIFLAEPVSSYKIDDFTYEMDEVIETYYDENKRYIGKRIEAYFKVDPHDASPINDPFDAIILKKPKTDEAAQEILLGEAAIKKLGLNTDFVHGFPHYLMMDRDEKGLTYHIRTRTDLSFRQIKATINDVQPGIMSKTPIFKFMRDIISILPTLHKNNLVFAKMRPETFHSVNNNRACISSLFGVLEKDTEEWKTSKGDRNLRFLSTAYWSGEHILPIHNYESLGWIGLFLATSKRKELFLKLNVNNICGIKDNGENMNLEKALEHLISSNFKFDKDILVAFKKYFKIVYDTKSALSNKVLQKDEWVWPKTIDLLDCFPLPKVDDNLLPGYDRNRPPLYFTFLPPPYETTRENENENANKNEGNDFFSKN